MIASSIYELALKCLECVNLHTESHKDPSWGRHYLRTVPTIVIAHKFRASPDTRISYR